MLRPPTEKSKPSPAAKIQPPLDYHIWVALPFLLSLLCLALPNQIQSWMAGALSGGIGITAEAPPSNPSGQNDSTTPTPTAPSGGSQNWVNPFPEGTFTSGFGYRVVTGKPAFTMCHYGIDLVGAQGSPVRASKSGSVTWTGDQHDGYGLKVVLSHPDGTKSMYAHNSQINVKVGDSVQQNQVIALVGSTGNSTAPHVHFEVTDASGTVIDPLTVLAQPKGSQSFGVIDTNQTCRPEKL